VSVVALLEDRDDIACAQSLRTSANARSIIAGSCFAEAIDRFFRCETRRGTGMRKIW
jgi:hypothetical protein